MKRLGKSAFFVVAVLIFVLAYTAFFGVYSQNGDFTNTHIKGAKDIRWGIDIRGGVEATFAPANDYKATEQEMRSAKSIIEVRLIGQNITDYELYTDVVNNRIIVRFPWKSDETDFDPETAINELAATAELTFHYGSEYDTQMDENDQPYAVPSGETILVGEDIKSAQVMTNTQTLEYMVQLELQGEGPEKFSKATTELAPTQGTISIWMDETMISAPTVQSAITDGIATITGSFTAEEADDLATKINAGAIPFKLETQDFGSISPTMGSSSLNAMLLAGVIALILIMILVCVLYRLPGAVASISLLGHTAALIVGISGYFPTFNSFTMTLSGIAGIILSIGMGVDANIITIERVRDELETGKTLDGAIEAGSANSFSAIFDGNITVLIVAAVLMGVFGPPEGFFAVLMKPFTFMFGTTTTGAIYSFGYTLFIGIICNFVFGVFASRTMLRAVAKFKFLRNKKLYGGEN